MRPSSRNSARRRHYDHDFSHDRWWIGTRRRLVIGSALFLVLWLLEQVGVIRRPMLGPATPQPYPAVRRER